MSPLLLLPLDDVFALLTPMAPGWVVPLVFAGMTVSVTTLIERRAQTVALRDAAGRTARGAVEPPMAPPDMVGDVPVGDVPVGDVPVADVAAADVPMADIPADDSVAGNVVIDRRPNPHIRAWADTNADRRTDLHAELFGALSHAQPHADSAGVRLEVAIPPGLMPGVAPAMLRPVLLPLLRNAIDHAPGGNVFVGAIRADDRVRIIIIDDGRLAAQPLAGAARASLARLLACSDVALAVDHRPGDGTTVMLCLPGTA